MMVRSHLFSESYNLVILHFLYNIEYYEDNKLIIANTSSNGKTVSETINLEYTHQITLKTHWKRSQKGRGSKCRFYNNISNLLSYKSQISDTFQSKVQKDENLSI